MDKFHAFFYILKNHNKCLLYIVRLLALICNCENKPSQNKKVEQTTNPSEKLTVIEKILCEEVEVILDVPAADYVFEKYYNGYSNLKADYVMPTLEEVESYTKANHHLPEVPSATTLKEDGLQLKEMSMILLQKIEELTLYTIEQEKRIKALEAQIVK